MAWRVQLGRFGLSGAHQTASIKQLSDDLQNRVVFAQLAMEHPNILLLDEPTNHLDMKSIDALAWAIEEFEGGVVIMSHSFRFISQAAEDLWEVPDKTIINPTVKDKEMLASGHAPKYFCHSGDAEGYKWQGYISYMYRSKEYSYGGV